MDFLVVTIVVILSPTSPVHGRILQRDTSQRATCTAPLATKGDTAVVTCHYPLDVKQPGEIVAVSVELYRFTSSNTGFRSSDYLLDCMWNKDFTCTLDEEEHRVEGRKVVITIKNVNKDNQGHYLCKMMVKDGPNIHGDPCQLLVNGTNPSDLLPQTTDPALDQQAFRDSVSSSAAQTPAGQIAAIGVGCAAAVAAVVVVAVFVRKKSGNRHPPEGNQPLEEKENQLLQDPNLKRHGAEDQGNNDDDNRQQGSSDDCPKGQVQARVNNIQGKEAPSTSHPSGNGPPAETDLLLGRGENQLPYQDPERPGARDERNNGDDNHGNGPPEVRYPLLGRGENQPPYRDPERPGARDERNNGDVNHGNGPPEERVPLYGRGENQPPYRDPDRPGARDERNNGDVNLQQGSSDDRPEGRVRAQVNSIEGKGAPSTSHPRQQGFSDDRPEGRVQAQVNSIEGKGAPSTSHPSGAEPQETGTETEPLLDRRDDPHPHPGQKSPGPPDHDSEDDGSRMEESSEDPHKHRVKALTARFEQR